MTRFFRLSGAGNDFLALLEPEPIPAPATIRDWCRRGLSLGADGLFRLSREGGELRIEHFNSDGGPAELCVNGSRCAARLAFHLGWARREVRLATSAGQIAARDLGPEGIELELAPPGPIRSVELEHAGGSHRGRWIRTGVPHLVLAWPEALDRAPVAELGASLRHHPDLAPEGANIDFVRFDPPDRLTLRTFERGVESETLACGSGVLAAVAVGVAEQGLRLPVRATTRGGCELTVRGEEEEGHIRRWWLSGEARLVAEGTIHPGARPAC